MVSTGNMTKMLLAMGADKGCVKSVHGHEAAEKLSVMIATLSRNIWGCFSTLAKHPPCLHRYLLLFGDSNLQLPWPSSILRVFIAGMGWGGGGSRHIASCRAGGRGGGESSHS